MYGGVVLATTWKEPTYPSKISKSCSLEEKNDMDFLEFSSVVVVTS